VNCVEKLDMRLAVLLILVLFGLPLSAHAQAQTPAPASTLADSTSQGLDDVKTVARSALQQSREAVSTALAATGLSNDQMWAIGVGVVAGAILADFIGTGSIGTLVLSVGGGYLGNWVAAPTAK